MNIWKIFSFLIAAFFPNQLFSQVVSGSAEITIVVTDPVDECGSILQVGGSCLDGLVVYAGESLSGGRLYAKSTLISSKSWNDGDANYKNVPTGAISFVNGAANTATIALSDSATYVGFQAHHAASACEDLDFAGYDDWNLPSALEAYGLYLNRNLLPFSSGKIWTSTESSSSSALSMNLGTGVLAYEGKQYPLSIVCVRRDMSNFPVAKKCEGVSVTGEICGNNTVIRVGESVSGGHLYAMTFPLPPNTWNDGDGNYKNIPTGTLSLINGSSNTAAISVADSTNYAGFQAHNAASVCADIIFGGYEDWYLPSALEAYEIYLNRNLLPFSSGRIWTSTETSSAAALSMDLGTGVLVDEGKHYPETIRCVRKNTSHFSIAKSCDSATSIGESCGNGNIRYVGEKPSGGKMFMTSAIFPATTWNDGDGNWKHITTSAISQVSGAMNTATIAAADSATYEGFQPHKAAVICADLVFGGYSDWYLPAVQESLVIYQNRSLYPMSGGTTWTSTENANAAAIKIDMSNGVSGWDYKYMPHQVRCVR